MPPFCLDNDCTCTTNANTGARPQTALAECVQQEVEGCMGAEVAVKACEQQTAKDDADLKSQLMTAVKDTGARQQVGGGDGNAWGGRGEQRTQR